MSADLIDLAKARRSRAYWGGLVVLKPGDGTDVVAEMIDFWGDDQREPPARLLMWAAALEDMAQQMRSVARIIGKEPTP